VAELTAVHWVLEMLIACAAPLTASTWIDSTYASEGVAWGNRVNSNAEMMHSARELYESLQGAVRLDHVRGHKGDAGNEMADVLAGAGRTSGWFPRDFPLKWNLKTLVRPVMRKNIINLEASLFWARVEAEDDPSEKPEVEQAAKEQVRMRYVTANVQTLLPAEEARDQSVWTASVRRQYLAQAFDESRADVVGIQEGRAREAGMMKHGEFDMWATAADPAGNGGVEAWVRRKALKGEPTVMHGDPRRLIMTAPSDLCNGRAGGAPCTRHHPRRRRTRHCGGP